MSDTCKRSEFSLKTKLGVYTPYLAFGAFFVTLPFLPPQFSLFGSFLVSVESSISHAVLTICGLLVGLSVAVWALRHEHVFAMPRAAVVSGSVVYALACVLYLLIATGVLALGEVGLCVASAVCGAGVIVPAIAWGFLFSRLSLHEAIGCMACAVGVGTAVNIPFVIGLFSSTVPAYILLLVVGLSVVVAAVAHGPLVCGSDYQSDTAKDEGVQVDGERAARSILPSTLGMCLGLFLLVLSASARCGAYGAGIMVGEYRIYESIAPLLAAILIVCFLITKKRIDLFEMANYYIPVLAVGFFVCTCFAVNTPLFDFGFLASSTLLAGIALLALASLAGVSRIGELSPWLLYSLLYAGIALSSLIGINVNTFLGREVGAGLLVLATAYFVFVILLALVRMRRLLQAPETITAQSHPGSAQMVIAQLSADYQLTDREREIFAYVASGHNSPYIAEKLFISEYTVRTHMRNMYRKFGVSSKEELIGFYETHVQRASL